jgi:signal transduction histidine kinase
VFSRWPIRKKLLLGVGLLLVIVLTLSISSFQGTYAFRDVVRSVSSRANELPYATELSRLISDLRFYLAEVDDAQLLPGSSESPAIQNANEKFQDDYLSIRTTVREYGKTLDENERAEFRIGDPSAERETLNQINDTLDDIEKLTVGDNWYLYDWITKPVNSDLLQLQNLTAVLPQSLHRRMHDLANDVKARYRTWIVLTWICAIAATTLTFIFIYFSYGWVFRPLATLVIGSRRVAAGDFNYHIELPPRDEMGELAEAMNDMTTRFRTIRDDLDRQVQLRTKQVVRSEQLASVGFLAAGVAHEINNPLAAIALSAESLESRLLEMCDEQHPNREVVQRYLKMIQSEAFRCKGITEKLLDFSRMGQVKHTSADLRELIQGVIDMVRHLGKYQNRQLQFTPGEPIIAPVNAQEMKQVVLNLVTNALDSVDEGGAVTIDLLKKPNCAEIIITDNGCGMTEEVQRHLFEPFFTRKRGGQGTGLGLSIVHRIVSDHGGQIEATSAGPGRGSQFLVMLPLQNTSSNTAKKSAGAKPIAIIADHSPAKSTEQVNSVKKENGHRYQAA